MYTHDLFYLQQEWEALRHMLRFKTKASSAPVPGVTISTVNEIAWIC